MKILNFRNTSRLFLLLFGIFTISRIFICPCGQCFLSAFCNNPIVFYLGLVFVYLGISVGMAFFSSSGFHYSNVLSHGDRSKPLLALTFDDGPDPGSTPIVLDILKKHRIKAAFFIIGKKIAGNEALLQRISDEGHITGNHSWSHSFFWDFYSAGRMAEEIRQNILETKKITGKRMNLFRPPYGVINPMVAKAISKNGVKVVGWSFRSFDTASVSPESLLKKTTAGIRPGDILLFHDSSKLTAGILDKIIVSLQGRGFSFISLDEMFKLQTYETL